MVKYNILFYSNFIFKIDTFYINLFTRQYIIWDAALLFTRIYGLTYGFNVVIENSGVLHTWFIVSTRSRIQKLLIALLRYSLDYDWIGRQCNSTNWFFRINEWCSTQTFAITYGGALSSNYKVSLYYSLQTDYNQCLTALCLDLCESPQQHRFAISKRALLKYPLWRYGLIVDFQEVLEVRREVIGTYLCVPQDRGYTLYFYAISYLNFIIR